MTDVWKSNARKFCELCKVWFADNSVSIQHHEAGQKHKAAIQAKLREVGKQSKLKEKEQASLQATLAMMESAALSSMTSNVKASCKNLPCDIIGPSLKPKSYLDPRAHKASVVSMAKEISKQKSERTERRNATPFQKVTNITDVINKPEKIEAKVEEEILWVETKIDDGTSYYFHMYTGESVWSAPEKYYTFDEYNAKFSTIHENCTSSVSNSTFSTNNNAVANSGQQAEQNIAEHNQSNDMTESSDQSNYMTESSMFHINYSDIPLPPTQDIFAKETEITLSTTKIENGEKDSIGDDSEKDILEAPVESQFQSTNISEEYRSCIKMPAKIGKINLELPPEANKMKKESEIISKEDKHIFSEKVARVHQKRRMEGVTIEFKKRKISKNVRQPVDNE